MNCREAKRLLADGIDAASNSNLRAHIETCDSCAREAESLQTLRIGLAELRAREAVGKIPFEFMKGRIAAASAERNNAMPRRIWIGPLLSATAALLVLSLAFFPWKEHKVVGYEVAISGVERQLVEETEVMCDLLMNLGLADADIDLIGCEATCKLQVVRLKSESEARLVKDAVTNIKDPDITVQIKPIRVSEKKTFL